MVWMLDKLLVSRPKLFMFDLDGTLVDSIPDLAIAVDRMLVALDRPPAGVDLVRDWVGNGQRLLVCRALARSFSGPELEALEQELVEEAIDLFREFYLQCCDHNTELFPGVEVCLQSLREAGVHMAVVTNKPIEYVSPILTALDIERYFSYTIGGDCVARKKPDPLPLEQCLTHYGLGPDEAVMVGDSVNDLVAAQRASVPVIAVSYGYNQGLDLYQYQPLLVSDDLSQLFGAG